MQTECSADLFGFTPVEGRAVVTAFDGGRMTSEAGAMLLGATDGRLRLTERFAGCFTDYRAAELVEHTVPSLVRQRRPRIVSMMKRPTWSLSSTVAVWISLANRSRPGLGGARLRRPLRRSARSDRVAGAVRGADLAFPETRGERRGAGSAAFVCGTLLSGHAIARFGIAVAV